MLIWHDNWIAYIWIELQPCPHNTCMIVKQVDLQPEYDKTLLLDELGGLNNYDKIMIRLV